MRAVKEGVPEVLMRGSNAVPSRARHLKEVLTPLAVLHSGHPGSTVCVLASDSDSQYRALERIAVHCPFCKNDDTRVVDTRVTDDGATIRRRRECGECRRRFTTLETSSFSVEKRSGVAEPFSRDKVTAGVRKACQGRPVSEHDLAVLAQQVEESLRVTGQATVSADEVGKAVLPFLRDLDEVAYLRFASVYSSFQSLEDFERAIEDLRTQ